MKLIDQIKQYCSHLDGKYYQLVTWDDNNFDIIEPIYHGAIVYQFSQNEDGTVTIRHRDSMQQERIKIAALRDTLEERVSITSLLKKIAND